MLISRGQNAPNRFGGTVDIKRNPNGTYITDRLVWDMGLRHSEATELKQGVLRMWLSWEGVYLACTKPLFGPQDSMN